MGGGLGDLGIWETTNGIAAQTEIEHSIRMAWACRFLSDESWVHVRACVDTCQGLEVLENLTVEMRPGEEFRREGSRLCPVLQLQCNAVPYSTTVQRSRVAAAAGATGRTQPGHTCPDVAPAAPAATLPQFEGPSTGLPPEVPRFGRQRSRTAAHGGGFVVRLGVRVLEDPQPDSGDQSLRSDVLQGTLAALHQASSTCQCQCPAENKRRPLYPRRANLSRPLMPLAPPFSADLARLAR